MSSWACPLSAAGGVLVGAAFAWWRAHAAVREALEQLRGEGPSG